MKSRHLTNLFVSLVVLVATFPFACGSDEEDGLDAAADAAVDVGSDGEDPDTGDAPDAVWDIDLPDGSGVTCGVGMGETSCTEGFQCILDGDDRFSCEGAYLGTCEPIPESCPEPAIEDLVCPTCGSREPWQEFGSECLARRAGYRRGLAAWPCVGVLCTSSPSGNTCPIDVACISAFTDCADGDEYSGECQYPPTACDPAQPADARCGCDGTRYESECHARLAGFYGSLTVCEGSGL